MLTSIPNTLSILRIVLSVGLITVYSGEDVTRYFAGLILIAAGVATDVLDGYLARKLRATSELGYILDGLGDRAAYIALILTFVAHHGVNLIIAWLLIFREIAIYALRLLRPKWYETNGEIRHFSRWHAAGIRVWFLTYLLGDGAWLFYGINLRGRPGFVIAQLTLSIATIVISYYGLYRIISGGVRRPEAAAVVAAKN